MFGLDAGNVLRLATSDDEVSTAVKVGLYKKLELDGEGTAWEELPEFKIGCDFFDSLRTHRVESGSELADKLLRAIVETVLHNNLSATHALRTGKEANKPQKMRGKDEAWRRDIDYEYHLHYWECASGSVELGLVVTHNDFSIPECKT